MRNLIQFLKKFRDFLIFFVLQVFVLTLFFNSKDYHRSKMTNTSSSIIGWFVEKKHNIDKHFRLSDANERLMNHNAELLSQQPNSFYVLQGDTYYVNDTLKKEQFQYIPATVINSSSTRRDNYFTLNKGTAQGIEIGMGVIADDGVVGIITDVSNHYAIVMTVLTEKSQINVKLLKNNEYWFLTWDGKDNAYAQIDAVKRDISIDLGDNVVTRGGGTQFPEGIAVGTIDEVLSKDGEQTIGLNIKLAVNYNAVYHVYVVKNVMRNEQLELEVAYFGDE
ncbi:MAG: rod shape-determining protein MreC [Crocinitomix sp.]|jgi:rod shape-determining protein MreC